LQKSNLGMYRVQLAGNDYTRDREVGLHYQLHRGIGLHHAAALERNEPLRVAIFVGGSPALAVSAVMPLPEGLSELTFAGVLAGHRLPMITRGHRPGIYADADFVIEGTVSPGAVKPEGPFGDHLGYYARRHDFPVMQVEHVWHREGAIWPMTVVASCSERHRGESKSSMRCSSVKPTIAFVMQVLILPALSGYEMP
jgi:4-hydroxy-3-polyprenylbenzoate decarboxylase